MSATFYIAFDKTVKLKGKKWRFVINVWKYQIIYILYK